MIRIITIEREYSCGAAAIAREASDRLGWKLWDQLLTQQIARLAHYQQSAVEERASAPHLRLPRYQDLEAM